ncbi:MAG: OmpA family protein [Bacteroidota bacterium]
MKKIYLSLICWAILASATTLFAQNPERPNSIMAKKLWIDHYSPVDGERTEFENFTDGFEVGYLRNLSPWLNAYFPMKVGVINLPEDINNKKIFGLDGVAQIQYYRPESPISPYLLVGIGGVMEDFEETDFQLPVGVGFNFRLGKFGFVNIQGEYRRSLTLDHHNFQYGIGMGFMLGKISDEDLTIPLDQIAPLDKDGDGVVDSKDDCPDVKGLAALGGCPDRDQDGIKDDKDECPDVFGAKSAMGCPDTDSDGFANDKDYCPDVAGSFNGCPDTDGDGLADKDDRCPNEAGDPENSGCPKRDLDKDGFDDSIDACPKIPGKVNGCPDTDGDGIIDKDDTCPFAAGEGRFNGCPDTDGDGIDDSKDRCPNMAAASSPNGCPELKEEDKAVLDYAIQAIQFEVGKARLKKASYAVLAQVLDVMQRYPDYHLYITGHTDDTGSESKNLQLSINRAKACYNHLLRKGVGSNRMSFGGFGESQPIAPNDDKEGRKLNRRVEFKLELK